MSKLTRTLALAAMLAAVNLAAMTAVAQARDIDPPPGQDAMRPPTGGQAVEAGGQHDRAPAPAQATVRRLLARERFAVPTGAPGPLAGPARPASPNGRAGWVAPALAGLAAVLVLAAGVAVLATRRSTRAQRAGQTA
jgi:hypothetical protein